MEARKIVIKSTKTQRTEVIMSSAETLGELKADLRANGIDYQDMTFFEGLTKIELKTDDSVLPHDVPYKGNITNELVFMLTNTNKKIRSGMDRKEMYELIRGKNLQKAVIDKYGKNFTQCKTHELLAIIEEEENKKKATCCKCTTSPNVATPNKEEVKKETEDTTLRKAFCKLLEILEDYGSIANFEKEDILDILGEKPSKEPTNNKSSYSKDEIDDMFSGMI